MRITLTLVAVFTVTACSSQAITELSKCERELGQSDVRLENAKERIAALEQQLRAGGAEPAVAAARPLPAPEPAPAAAPVAAAEAPAPTPAPVAAPAPVKKGPMRIGLSLPTQREERWVKDKLVMIAAAKKRKMDLLVQVSEGDPARQAAQCDNMIAQGIRVLIVAPHDATKSAAIVEKAARAGVRIISYDRLIMDSPHDYYYLSFDGVKVGALQGEFLTRKVPKGVYVVLSGAPTDNNAKLFHEGAMKYIQPLADKGAIQIVMNQPVIEWRPEEAQKLCEKALAANSKINAILAPNDGTAGGCIQALAAKGLAGKIPITGQDGDLAAAQRIVQGTQSMTVFKDTRQLGQKAIEMAYDLITGKAVETQGRTVSNNKRQIPSVLLSPTVVTKENLDAALINSKYLNREAVYRGGK
jgi:D-xylose transport system substrate-binding protein